MRLQISTVILIGLFILCCTGNMDGILARFRFRTGRIAALSLLLMALSALEYRLGAGFSVYPASLAALTFSILAVRGERDAYSLPLAAFAGGVLGWLLSRAFPNAWEAGALLALPAALLARVLYRGPRTGLCLPLLSPLFYALCVMLEDWYLFGFASLGLGSALQLDAQLCGATLYGLLLLLPDFRRRAVMQKEA